MYRQQRFRYYFTLAFQDNQNIRLFRREIGPASTNEGAQPMLHQIRSFGLLTFDH
jgi:hypothetical protein